jgi:hypothetical protein
MVSDEAGVHRAGVADAEFLAAQGELLPGPVWIGLSVGFAGWRYWPPILA